ncbi:FAD-dependent oxidoreductase [Streptomyces griseoaurantiacus]|uniref:FAD-dependent oxidoreductase n=1 Tax=Streptomyces griseoaurantiacus TaxID=68213 RepID=UPI003794B969
MTKRARNRVGIIGAGPGGLSAAICLHRLGFDVTVFERWPEVRSVGGGIALWPPPLKALEIMGIDIDELGAPAAPSFVRPNGRLIAAYPEAAAEEIDTPLWLGAMRASLYQELRDRLPADRIKPNKKCIRVEQDGEAIAHFEDGTVFRGELIIGADGLHSVVRANFEKVLPPRDNNLTVWLGHTWADVGDRSYAKMGLDPRGYQGSYTPMRAGGRDGWHWWLMERRESTGVHETGEQAKNRLKELAAGFAEPLPSLICETSAEDIVPWVIRDRPALKSWVDRRITVLGDAAHATNPYAGYGAGMAVVDGFYLGCSLAGVDISDQAALTAVLEDYEAARKPETDGVAAFAYKMGQLMHTPNPVKRVVRDLLLDRTPFMRKQLAAQYGEPLTEAYRTVVRLGARLPQGSSSVETAAP